MALVTTKQMLLNAQAEGYAVGAFNVENMEMVQAVVAAAEELRAPVILQTTPSTIRYADISYYYAAAKVAAEKASVPVAVHLDHGSSFELAMKALRVGYTSIMIDGSHESLDENIRLSKAVADAIRQGFRWKQSWEKSAERKTVWTAAAAIPTRTRQKQNCLYPPPALIFWRLPSALPTAFIRASRTLIWSGCQRSAVWWTSRWFCTAPPVYLMKRYANVFGAASARLTMRRISESLLQKLSVRYCKPIPKPSTPKNTAPPAGRP